ncbi:hypothetical protein SOVF_166320 [Spinacia oleracea]|nr:hypothetical protein SOVF_166320 [Spinacia oleracea]
MYSQQQQQQQQEDMKMMEINGGKMGSSNNSNQYLCRESSTRWTPTSEQITLLKELYYINGVRSPTADQIQTICARLIRYGKIEGKNVFYWFQNHKARERQKKRLTPNSGSPTTTTSTLPTTITATSTTTIPQFHNNFVNNVTLQPTINNPVAGIPCSSSSAGHANAISGDGQFVESFGYGGVTMQNTFRECSISGGEVINGRYDVRQWNAVETNYSKLLDKISTLDEYPYTDQDHNNEIETLPLFPMHNQEHDNVYDQDQDQDLYTIKPPSDGYYTTGYRWFNGSGGNTSLELSLNSYGSYAYYSPSI